MNAFRILITLQILGLFAVGARAADAIVWHQTSLSDNAAIGQAEVVAVYGFTNTSDKPVRLTDVQPSCGCTVPTLEKDTYNPGETGKITATFEFVFMSGWAPDASQQKPLRPGSAARRLADALHTKEQSAGDKASFPQTPKKGTEG